MAFELFGFRIGKPEDKEKQAQSVPSFTPPPNDDGALEVAPGGAYGTFVDLEGRARNEADLVTRYRDLSLQFEVDRAIEEIVNEAIIREGNKPVVEINLENVNTPDKVKEKIRDEFKQVLRLLDFQNIAYDIFRRWYVDGRMYYHVMIDENNPRDGIKELRYIDPRRIRKVREMIRLPTSDAHKKGIVPPFKEYYTFFPVGTTPGVTNQGIKIAPDSIAFVHSGIMDQRNRMILSHVHVAIKAMNQLRMLEDATVIYRLSRAPERRIFYIDVGNMPKLKAEQYLRDMMVKHKNRLVYDASTGEVRDDRKHMTMLEDFWLPRREGNRGTEITTLPGGQNLGELADVEYFRQKLYQSLRVPTGRINADNNFLIGRTGEISRDEVRFSKFIDRLRTRFSILFDTILEKQLVLRGVMTIEEWKQMKEYIHYDFLRDNYYSELKEQEIQNARLAILQNVDPYVGKYFSKKYVMTKVLRMTEEEMQTIQSEIQEEGSDQEYEANMGAGGPPGAPPQPGMAGPPPGGIPQPKPQSTPPLTKKKLPGSSNMREDSDFEVDPKVLTEEEQKLIESLTKFVNENIEK